MRHSINEDIPQEGRKIAKRSYLLWQGTYMLILASSIGFALNLAAAIGFKTSQVQGYNGIGGLLLAIVYLVLMPPLSFYFWHLALYKAIKRNSSSRFVMYFINFGIDIGFCIFLVVGLFQGGGGGLIGMIAMFDAGNIAAGAISAVCVGYLTIYVLLGCFQLKSVSK